MRYIFLAVALITIMHVPVYSQTGGNEGSISDIQFIEGSWKATAGDRSIDAVWSSPSGESMVGYVRVMKDGKVSLYELFAFEKHEQGLVALVRHFRPGLIAAEEKDNPNHYTFLEAGSGRAVFQRQGEETRVLYEKRSENQFAIVNLTATSSK
jgi:hypothetical protein